MASCSGTASEELVEAFFLSDSIGFLLDFIGTGVFSVFSGDCMGSDAAALKEEG
jgi:hypothetical protein